ncbi:unnamed protein product [Ambrosiozyma monospora]|uniref:Unnamed protein product n=1 Tax=Ambrosiozyma monospora TaxID=43982 RepID=A0A9W6WMV9_AMBMO|nr:unnamed protein product [Ambrosiozyma monospora]
MSTTIYSHVPLSEDEIQQRIKESAQNELRWLIQENVIPQLPAIQESLQSCFDKLAENNQDEYRLPLSTHNSEFLKGIITRQHFNITGLQFSIKTKSLNSGKHLVYKLNEGEKLVIRQLLDCHDAIHNAIKLIDRILKSPHVDTSILLSCIEQMYNQISFAKNSLTTPKPEYMFPRLRIASKSFTPELPEFLALDFLVTNSDLSIDMKVLKKVTAKPWDTVLEPGTRLTWVDQVRSRISRDRTKSINKILMEEYDKLQEWKKREHEQRALQNKETGENDAAGGTFGSALKSMFGAGSSDPSLSTLIKTASKFLEEAVTYMDNEGNANVVTILESCDVMTSDPVLLSMTIKLESLEKSVSKTLDNLKNCL